MSENIERTAVVLAGGGERVIAWQVGVLAGLADSGVDAGRAGTIVGTSAGAYVAARLAAGEDMRSAARRIAEREPQPIEPVADSPFERLAEAFAAAGTVLEGRRRIGAAAMTARTGSEVEFVAQLAGRLPQADWPRSLRIVTVDAERGERVVLDSGTGVSIATGVAASRAVPLARPPITVAGRRLIDGAIGSATNADVPVNCGSHDRVDRVIVIAALPTDPEHARLSELWDDALRAELWQLDAADVETYIVRARAAELAVMGPDPMDGGGAPLAVLAGREAGRTVGPALRGVLEPVPPRSRMAPRRPRISAGRAAVRVPVTVAGC